MNSHPLSPAGIAERRQKADLRRSDLARLSGVQPGSIYRYETGERDLLASALLKLDAVLPPVSEELRAIDAALGYHEGSTRTTGDRVARIEQLQQALRQARADDALYWGE